MAKSSPTLYLLLLISLYISSTAKSAATAPSSLSFVKSSCNATTYPAVCFQSLSPFATLIRRNQRLLVHTALSVSLSRVGNTRRFVHKLTKLSGLKDRERSALRDCVQEVSDSIDSLSQSIKELKKTGSYKGKDFEWRMSNIETWVSAALTDEGTCLDGFDSKALNGRVKTSIKERIVSVAHVTSNALALINKYASTH
ncbi:hypothetical protein K2173_008686 [Erythroxylum novogranatense]|uniref:Pectinesterase inhibitor domain-containing protein n=1 Tax=Erythroxylum novogranatense TaxID=1862640 RepID=A0AAV8SKZ7_9ROSI|nr:hypothetical protein K2173_008686 [Erythroxylum novogranatense]